MRKLADKLLYRFGYVRADDYDDDDDDDYNYPVPPDHEVFETVGVDVFKIHVGDPGPCGIENVSAADPEARVLEDFWGNDNGPSETITHLSKWRDGTFIEAKPLYVSKVWGGGRCTFQCSSY